MGAKGTGIMAAFFLTAHAALGGVFTIGGFTFDEDNTVKTAKAVEGGIGLQDHSNKIFARAGKDAGRGVAAASTEYLAFDRSKTLGRLMGFSGRRPTDESRGVSFPERNKGLAQPNLYRVMLELTWGTDTALPNKPGYDFVVYEAGSYEGFAVSVRKAGSTEFSAPRYRFADRYDATHGVNAVAFDISSFGLADGEKIDAIRIRNIFNSDSPQGPDKVDEPSGQGKVLYPGDPGYESAFKLAATSGSSEFRTDDLDADLVYVAGLHAVVKSESK